VAQLRAQRKQIEDGLALEVTQAFQAIREADVAMDTSRRQVQSAQEAYRVARELFNAGRATSTTLTDAETDLTRARLEVLNARVDARVARVRLEHAVGRDARQAPAK
jgi:outer membrane protein TolC